MVKKRTVKKKTINSKKKSKTVAHKVKVHKKHGHPLLIFFLIALLLFIVSFQYGKLNRTFEVKRVAAIMITENNPELALEYCRKMEYKNYECFDMYIEAKKILNQEYDPYICKEINVGKLPWWSTVAEEREALIDFNIVRNKCLN